MDFAFPFADTKSPAPAPTICPNLRFPGRPNFVFQLFCEMSSLNLAFGGLYLAAGDTNVGIDPGWRFERSQHLGDDHAATVADRTLAQRCPGKSFLLIPVIFGQRGFYQEPCPAIGMPPAACAGAICACFQWHITAVRALLIALTQKLILSGAWGPRPGNCFRLTKASRSASSNVRGRPHSKTPIFGTCASTSRLRSKKPGVITRPVILLVCPDEFGIISCPMLAPNWLAF